MKVYISCDMEGVSGIVDSKQTRMDGEEYKRAQKLMTGEVNAAIEGALAGGATEILVNDSHGLMRNILIEELNPNAQLISGSSKPLSMMQGIDESFDAAFFIGYHAQAGTPYSVLDHTYSSIVYQVSLNGRPVGETGLNADPGDRLHLQRASGHGRTYPWQPSHRWATHRIHPRRLAHRIQSLASHAGAGRGSMIEVVRGACCVGIFRQLILHGA